MLDFQRCILGNMEHQVALAFLKPDLYGMVRYGTGPVEVLYLQPLKYGYFNRNLPTFSD